MDFIIQETRNHKIAVIDSPDHEIKNEQEALDVIAEAGYLGAEAIILPAENLISDFFDLKTGVAGTILQKFSNYRMKLAILGAFEQYQSRSLAAFIRESNRGNLVFFVPDLPTALEYLFPETKPNDSNPEEKP
ncbi:MAG: DUF4180 domain-containing protein [Anaerolineales bacterium]